MSYRRYSSKTYRQSKTSSRIITVKYAAPCMQCGVEIKAGDAATYYPAGFLSPESPAKLAHAPDSWDGSERVSTRCAHNLMKAAGNAPPRHCNHQFRPCQRGCGAVCQSEAEDRAVNAYAGDGLDERYEDDCAARCGLI